MEKVATQNFTVPLGEVPTIYSGGFTSIALAKPQYAPGESIRMILMVWARRSANWLDLIWHSTIIAYNTAGVELTRVSATHVAWPGVDDYETYDVDLNLGLQPAAGLSGRLELWCDGSPAVKVATVSFGVPVTGGIPPPEEKKFPWWILGVAAGTAAVVAVAATRTKKRR